MIMRLKIGDQFYLLEYYEPFEDSQQKNEINNNIDANSIKKGQNQLKQNDGRGSGKKIQTDSINFSTTRMFKCPRKKRRYLWNVRVEKLKIYFIGDYLRQLILEDLTSSIALNKSKEQIAEERCKKIQKFLNSKAGLLKKSSKSINQELKYLNNCDNELNNNLYSYGNNNYYSNNCCNTDCFYNCLDNLNNSKLKINRLNYCRKNYCTPTNCCDIHVNFIYHIRNGIKKKKRLTVDGHINCKNDDKYCNLLLPGNSTDYFTLHVPDKKIINRSAVVRNGEIKSGTNVADDYFRQVYELLKQRRDKEKKIFNEKSNRRKVAAGFCQDEKKDQEKFEDENRGEEALVSPVVGGPNITCSFYIKNNINNNNNDEQQINEDNKVNSYFLRSKIRPHDDLSSSSTSSFHNDNDKQYPRQPISVKCKINAKKDISKYFDYPNKENNQSHNYNSKKNSFNLTGDEDASDDSVMGSNLSRHHGKGLTGRRTQSSGNLCDSKGKLSHVGKMLVPCSSSSEDRYKFSGSLPNNLDNDHDFMLVNNNNVITDTIAGNLGGTLPHKKSSVQFNDEVTDFEQYRLQTLEGDPWEYHQNDIDIVRCKHGNLNLVRKSQHNNTDEYVPSNNQHYDSELMGTLPKRRIDPKWCDPTSIQSIVQQYNHHDPGEIDLSYPQNVKIIHKPTCELMKHHRHQLERLDNFNSKPTSSEHQDQGYASERSPEDEHPPLLTINPENTFQVTLQKSSRGLGLSVSGGGKSGPVRVKRLFPQQPAALSNKLEPGDILLAVNGIPLTGLTNYEALEVLRTTSNTVELLVCRLPGEPSITPPKAPPTPPTRREASLPSRFLKPVPPLNIEPCGEFDIEMTKVAGSLGFTLRKVDSSALGHYVRALVREPALSDGRIQPGDKIVTVDGVPLSPMSHEEAVALLRQCGPRVKLRLYRDLTQTPVSALSPTEPDHPLRPPRTSLRKEAVDMLCDLAVRKLSPNGSNGSMSQNTTATNSSPRRLRRPASRTSMNDDKNEATDNASNINLNQNNSQVNTNKALRPNYLNLSNGELKSEMSNDQNIEIVNSSAITANNSVEADEYYDDNDALIGDMQDSNLPLEPASMPPLVFDTDNNTADANFSYKNPAYQSANPTCSGNDNIKAKGTYSSDKNIPGKISTVQDPAGSKSLLKWKGVMFAPDDSNDNADNTTKNDNFDGSAAKEDKYKDCEVFMVELTRGWNSRLGFSLQSHNNSTIISMVHPDSVAAKDGRLRQGDVLLMVNDESVENLPTTDIIDLLRKIRGSIGITVARQKKSTDT